MPRSLVVLAVVLAACGHYSFESAVMRGDGGGDDGDAGADRDAMVDAPASLMEGLEVWIDCEEILASGQVADASDNGSTIDCEPELCPEIVPGPFGRACRFDGDNDVITVAPDPRFDTTTFTMAVWARLDVYPGDRVLATWIKHAPLDENYELFGAYARGVGGGTTELIAGGDSDPEDYAYVSLGVMPLQTWVHIAVSYDATAYRMYRDGVLDDEAPYVAHVRGSMDELVFGAEFNANNRAGWWEGALDEARFYSRVLSDAEVAALATP